MDFKAIIDRIIEVEKGYSNNPADKGGETNYGITVAVARANGYAGPMASMPRSVAETIYLGRYITIPGFDRVTALSEPVGRELIDTGVNMGPGKAAEFLQRWLNGFCDGKHYTELFVDSRLGSGSLAALAAFIAWRGKEGEQVLTAALNSTQGNRYLDIAERDTSQRQFVYGWLKNRVMVPA